MSKKLLLVLGNGFTIDFLNHTNKSHEIDVSNFFKYGAEVPWPETKQPGFLSYKHCPNLWNLGARPNMANSIASELIEDIITCINVYAAHPKKSALAENKNDIYFSAYLELLAYLRSLFVFYNQKIDDILESDLEWIWAKYLKKIIDESIYEEVNIVTYNYDIWLERILQKANISFSVNGFPYEGENREIIEIFKPHGSISFKHGSAQDHTMYTISYEKEIKDAPISEFIIDYENLEDYHLINALIPPAGEAGRIDSSWSKQIHSNIETTISGMSKDDDCIICGLSYWHVDRNELDDILVNCNPEMNVKMINPNPTKSFTAVLTSLFSKLIVYPDAKILERLV